MSKIDYGKAGFGTRLIHEESEKDPVTGATVEPIHLSVTYGFDSMAEMLAVEERRKPGYVYSRFTNPTTAALERKLAAMHGAEAAVCTASGMGAISAFLTSFLQTGDHVVCSECVYGGTDTAMRSSLQDFGIGVTFVDIRDLAAVEKAITPKTKVLYFETPMNPTTMIADVRALAEIGRRHNLKTAVDSTFAPPPVQNPLEMGVDIVLHSTTKYLNGHGDAMGGAVIGSAEDIDRVLHKSTTIICGTPQHPFTSYLVLRGLKTLHIRMERHSGTAMKLARALEGFPQVARVFYPGLESHPQHALAKAQMKGMYSGMLAFEIKDGIHGLTALEAVEKFLVSMKIPTLAASLADPETLNLHPATGSHRHVPLEARLKAGITDGLVRVSAGLEDAEDLIGDFQQALDQI